MSQNGIRRQTTQVIETIAVGLGGAALGYVLGNWIGGKALGIGLAVIAGLNGFFGGARGIYAWRTPGGWFAFVLDSTWAIVSTTLGVILSTINTAKGGSGFGAEFSVRQNRHVFSGGFALKRSFANTQGNVISNACLGRGDALAEHRNLIERHEGLHVWQQRWFGPLHPALYIIWGVLGAVVAIIFGLTSRQRRSRGIRIGQLVETAAYYDNPFEYWAYKNDGRWEKNSAQSILKWGSFKWPPDG